MADTNKKRIVTESDLKNFPELKKAKVKVGDMHVFSDTEAKSSKESLYSGTVRVVTEADIKNDPRLVAASVVVGQLYDFSNLPYVKDGAIEADVDGYNEAKDLAAENKVDVVANPPAFTSEAERVEMGLEPKLKDTKIPS